MVERHSLERSVEENQLFYQMRRQGEIVAKCRLHDTSFRNISVLACIVVLEGSVVAVETLLEELSLLIKGPMIIRLPRCYSIMSDLGFERLGEGFFLHDPFDLVEARGDVAHVS